jgi:formamidopyrimidine-DNA glycosylase
MGVGSWQTQYVISRLQCDDRAMPELPEVEAVRREIEPVLRGARITAVTLNRDNLRDPFPVDFADRLRGRTVVEVTRRGKYLLAALSSGETLLMHLGMSGSFRVERGGLSEEAHDHVLFGLSTGVTLIFNDPRRFGLMDLVAADGMPAHRALGPMGPEPLSPAFTGAALASACAGRAIAIKVALLDQRVVAGVGNIYASEALHLAGLSPRKRASAIATPSGAPRPAAEALARAIKAALRRAITQTTSRYRSSSRFRVYEREGEACLKAGCRGTIRRITQAGRSTYYCPVCQR